MEAPQLIVLDVVIQSDQKTAKLKRGTDIFKIESITLGLGSKRKTIDWDKHLMPGTDCRAEVLPNKKLNIITSSLT